MKKLHGILYRHNMSAATTVDTVYHRRQRSRFATAGWSCDQDQSLPCSTKFSDNRGQTKVTESWDLKGNYPEHRRYGATLKKHIGPESGDANKTEAEIDCLVPLKELSLPFCHLIVSQRTAGIGIQYRFVEGDQVTGHSHPRYRINGQMQITSLHPNSFH
jgi:hypothetical protein